MENDNILHHSHTRTIQPNLFFFIAFGPHWVWVVLIKFQLDCSPVTEYEYIK